MNPIIIIHGALGAQSQLKGLADELSVLGKRAFLIDLAGHGGKPFRSTGFGIEAFADDLNEFIGQHRIDGADVFGYSMGGYVALWLALNQPGKLGRIITLGTKFDWDSTSAQREVNKLNPEKILLKIPAFARILEHRHKPLDWKELMSKTGEMMLALGTKPLLTLENARHITNNTSVLLGDQDDMADASFSKSFALALPHGTFITLDRTPHPIERVDVNRLANLILGFTKD